MNHEKGEIRWSFGVEPWGETVGNPSHLKESEQGKCLAIRFEDGGPLDGARLASPASGLGTTPAIVGAYALAGELASATGEFTAAFARYDRRMRPFITTCHTRARAGGNLYISRSKFWWQMQQIRLSNISLVRRRMARAAAEDKQQIANSIDLP